MPKFNVHVVRRIKTSRAEEPRGNPDFRRERIEHDYRSAYVVVEAATRADARAAAEKAAFEHYDDLEWVEGEPPVREERTTFAIEPSSDMGAGISELLDLL